MVAIESIKHYLTILKTSFLVVGIFLTYNNNFISNKANKFIKYTFLVFCLVIPIIDYSQFPYVNTDYLNSNIFLRYEAIFHYISLIAQMILFWRLIKFSKKLILKKRNYNYL
jgi:hypothetical protein